MIINNNGERLHEIYDTFKDSFVSFFHTALWRIYADNITAGKVCCFVRCWKNGNLQLGIAYANESGWQPLPTYFADGITGKQAQDIVDFMNEEVFGLCKQAAFQIEISSMTAQPKEEAIEEEEIEINQTP